MRWQLPLRRCGLRGRLWHERAASKRRLSGRCGPAVAEISTLSCEKHVGCHAYLPARRASHIILHTRADPHVAQRLGGGAGPAGGQAQGEGGQGPSRVDASVFAVVHAFYGLYHPAYYPCRLLYTSPGLPRRGPQAVEGQLLDTQDRAEKAAAAATAHVSTSATIRGSVTGMG